MLSLRIFIEGKIMFKLCSLYNILPALRFTIKTKKGHFIHLTLIELSADELIKTGSLAKKCSDIIEQS